MKIDLKFADLAHLVSLMGAQPSDWKPSETLLDPIEILRGELAEGREVHDINEVEVKDDVLLTYKGQQVVLYIKDTRKDRFTLLNDQEHAPRFHVAECSTLDRMRREGRFERYVVTTRKDGKFRVEAMDFYSGETEELEAPLHVCRNCLSVLNWKGYREKSKRAKLWLRDEFSMEDFFAEFATYFRSKPSHSDESAPTGGYCADWSKISEALRSQKNWRCDKCRVDLTNHRSLLHCHHKNGVTSDNRPDNIAVLCVLCHAEEPSHGWMKPSVRARMQIESLRAQQRGREAV